MCTQESLKSFHGLISSLQKLAVLLYIFYTNVQNYSFLISGFYCLLIFNFLSENDTSDPCGGGDPKIVISSTEGILSSPGYPSSNQNNLDCRWRIMVNDGSTIQISFLDFDLEDG